MPSSMLSYDEGEDKVYWVDTPLVLECGLALPTSYKKSFRFKVRQGEAVKSGDIILEWGYIKALGRSPVAKSPVDGTVVGLMRPMKGTRYYVVEIKARQDAVDHSRYGNERVPAFFDDVMKADWEIRSMGFFKRIWLEIIGQLPKDDANCVWPKVGN